MTEIPEHLLKRSQARRAGGEAADAASTPATTPGTTPGTAPAVGQAATPAVAAPKAEVVPASPPPAKPDIAVVAAYKARKKIPVWAMVTLSILPLWAFMYVLALKPEPVKAIGPLGEGAKVYSGNCVGCHQPGGAGVAGGAYKFTEASAITTFPHIEDQLRWVHLGSPAYVAAGVQIAGDPNREGGPHIAGSNGVMPARGGGEFTDAQILAAVCDERYSLGGVAEDTEEFTKWCSADSAIYLALEDGTANFDNVHTQFDGVLEIGSVPKEGTTAG